MRLLLLALLAISTSACDSVSRYLAGMDDPQYFSWEQGEVATLRSQEKPQEPGARPTHETRERFPGLAAERILEPPEEPKPVADTTTQPKTLAQDLRDCKAPRVPAPSAETAPRASTPTIERSEQSPIVAACMAEKGYRKVYRARTGLW